MRNKFFLVLVAMTAILFAGCNKTKTDNPSIADTSAKQTQPSEEQAAAAIDTQTDAAANNNAQIPSTPQDQLGAAQDPSATMTPPAADATASPDQSATTAPATSDTNSAANNGTSQVDETQTSQAQIPGLPDSTATPAPGSDNNNSSTLPQS